MQAQPRPRTFGISETAQTLSVGRSTIYKLINEGKLSTIKLGRRTLILAESIDTLLSSSTDGPSTG